MTFGNQVKELVDIIEEMGNPFLKETTDLLRLDTRDIVDQNVLAHIQAETIGQQMCYFSVDPLKKRSPNKTSSVIFEE